MTDDLTGDLDLLGDWLDAKGYGEEAGLCTRVMDHMHKQDARIAELEAALKPFACPPLYVFDKPMRFVPAPMPKHWEGGGWVSTGDFRAARAAMEGK